MHLTRNTFLRTFFIALGVFSFCFSNAQLYPAISWSADGNTYYQVEKGNIAAHTLPANTEDVLLSREQLTPPGEQLPLTVRHFLVTPDAKKVLIYTHTQKVWRYDTRGDYWLYDINTKMLTRLGKDLPASSLMFAKFSPDASKVAYVSGHNIYVEDLSSHTVRQITNDGTRQLINGTFDWVYEEEFSNRDGFRWSPDSQSIAFWQINDSSTRDYYMLNTTDSVYSHVIPVEYPIAGELPSPAKIGVIPAAGGATRWMNIPIDPSLGSYIPRMEWAANSRELVVQHLDRRQQVSETMICQVADGSAKTVYTDKDTAWVEVLSQWDDDYKMGGWDWLKNGAEFLQLSEKDGWMHAYRISRDGSKQTLITPGNYDVINIAAIDEKNNQFYFIASPQDATEKYLYHCRLDGKGKAERLSPAGERGTHDYEISPNGRYAMHSFSNYYTPESQEWVTLPGHKLLPGSPAIALSSAADSAASNIRFIRVKTADGVSVDGWMQLPVPFDSTKKYPVLFYVYTEPGSATVKNSYGITGARGIYQVDLAKTGYIYISLDGRGTPAPKGAAWRKSIYRRIGRINIRDQGMAATEILKWPYVDSSRIAVWGWSGGGSATLNLLFQFPQIYKTGIAVAALGNMETYDNIYQERYMGIPQETKADYVAGSAVNHAASLQGNLLYIHGTGDDNVHFGNAEMLVNQLIKFNKPFQYMAYPNRTHSISEGPGTREHLGQLMTGYLLTHCPPGAR